MQSKPLFKTSKLAKIQVWQAYFTQNLSPGPNVLKLFSVRNLQISVISLRVCPWRSFSSLVLCLWVRPGAYLRWQHLKRLGRLQPYSQILTRVEKLVRAKHSSLLRKVVNYGQKRFITLGPIRIPKFELFSNQGILKGEVSLYCWPPV